MVGGGRPITFFGGEKMMMNDERKRGGGGGMFHSALARLSPTQKLEQFCRGDQSTLAADCVPLPLPLFPLPLLHQFHIVFLLNQNLWRSISVQLRTTMKGMKIHRRVLPSFHRSPHQMASFLMLQLGRGVNGFRGGPKHFSSPRTNVHGPYIVHSFFSSEMSSKLFLPLLLLSFLAIAPVQPMMKSPEEQQEKTPQFWSFFLHPGTFETARGEQAERLEAEQQQQEGTKMKQEEMNTSEQGKAESDYYDAAREEDEQQKGKTNNKMENEANETAPLINLMAALRVNVDPSPVMLVEGSVEGDGGKKARNEKGEEGTMRRIVFPEAGKGNQTEKEKFVLDGDSYDEERAEMGKADEEDDGEEEGGGGKNATKMMTQPDGTGDIVVLLPKGKEILATEGMGGGRGEEEEPMVDGEAGGRRDEEEDGRWPIVDGTTGNDDDDGEEGGGGKAKDRLEPPKAAKIFGIA